jgi:hypothetical protein
MFLPSAAIPFDEAKANGYQPLTTPFRLPGERQMLDRMQRDLEGVDYILAGNKSAPEIWRKGIKTAHAEKCCVAILPDPRGTSRPLGV